MSVVFRPCAASNTAAIIALILRIQRDEFGAAVAVADQTDRAAIADVYLADDGGFCVAERDGAIGGAIGVQDVSDARAALRKMFVAADARGGDLGVAAGLLRSLLEHAAARGLREIFLGTTEAFFAAHRCHEKTGFVEIARGAWPASLPRMHVDRTFYRLML